MASTGSEVPSSEPTRDPNFMRLDPTQTKIGSNQRQVRGWRAGPSDNEEQEWERAIFEDSEQVRQSCEDWALFSSVWGAWQEWQVAWMPWGFASITLSYVILTQF